MTDKDSITITYDKSTGNITLTDQEGRTTVVKGVLLVGHDSQGKQLIFMAQGCPSEIATGIGVGLASLMDKDPYYTVLYRSILMDLCIRTGVKPENVKTTTGPQLLARWESEDRERAEKEKKTFH